MSVQSPPESGADHGPSRGVRAYYQDAVRLPGFGLPPDRCRPLHPVGFCEGSGHVVLGQSSCETRRCPDHFRGWIERAVVNLTARLAAYRYAQEAAGKRLVHTVVSPPQEGRWPTERLWDRRRDAYRAAEAAGVRGGVAVTHPYRASDEGEHLWEAATELGEWEEDRGKWALFRDAAEDWAEMREYIEAAPHYHVLAAAEDVNGAAAPDGWVVENIRSMPRFHYRDVESYRPMARTAWYLLTHGAVQTGRNTTTWFGEIHPAAFDPAAELPAAVWERIQINAGKTSTTEPGGTPIEDGVGAMECQVDGCESAVVPIEDLRSYLSRGEWVRSLRRAERRKLRMVVVWWFEEGDRPPPAALSNPERVRNWLDEKGRVYFEGSHQVGLPGVGPS